MRGRKPKPTALKIIEGNPGGRPLNKNEPQPVAPLEEAPEWFDDLQREYWQDALASAPVGLFGTMDRELLVVWCSAAAIMRRAYLAQSELDAEAEKQLLSESGYAISPYINIVNKQSAVMLKAASEMGFTPSSRSRISIKNPTAKGNDFDGF